MSIAEAKATIFHWLCSRYRHGTLNDYVDKDTVMQAINISEDDFGQALEQFGDPYSENHAYVQVEIPTGRLKLGTDGLAFCQEKKNPYL